MRAGTMVLVCALIAMAAPAAAQSCAAPTASDARDRIYDRSWIRSDALFYGADERGMFKLRLRANAIQLIGEHGSQPPERVQLSPSKRWLEYERSGPFEYWLYDSGQMREHRIDIHSVGSVQVQFSPDDTSLAWLERSSAEHRLGILDLNSFDTRRFQLQEAPDPMAIFFDLTWSAKGDRLTYAWRDAERQEFFSVDAVTGVAKAIQAPREFGADEFVESSYLLGNGVEAGKSFKPVRASKDSIALERGANVQHANGKIVVSVPRQQPRTIADNKAIPPLGCGPSLALFDAFDGRYVLYRVNGVYWIYGLRENRKAILYRGSAYLEW